MSVGGQGKKEREKLATWVGVGVAVISLVAALVFNGLQVRDSARAQRQAKTATELALLAQIQGTMTEAAYRRVPFAKQFRKLRKNQRSNLSDKAFRVVAEEGADMNYFAWLFNRGYVTADGADELLGPQMVCEYQQAIGPALEEAPLELPDLLEFIQERGPHLQKLAQACQAH